MNPVVFQCLGYWTLTVSALVVAIGLRETIFDKKSRFDVLWALGYFGPVIIFALAALGVIR